MLTISEMIVLGSAVPEQTKNNGKTVCVAGWAEDLGFVRIYPCRADYGISRWDRLRDIKVRRNPKDSRLESYKLWDEKSFRIDGGIKSASEKIELLESIKQDCVHIVRDGMLSLGLVRVDGHIECNISDNPSFSKQETIAKHNQEYNWLLTKQDFSVQPKLTFSCGGKCLAKNLHNMTVVDWGGFEWIRKSPGAAINLRDNWKITNPEYDVYLLVGNLFQHRTSFIVISVIPVKKQLDANIPMFPQLQQLAASRTQHTIQQSVSRIVATIKKTTQGQSLLQEPQ